MASERIRRIRATTLAGIACVALAAACGTTVPLADQRSPGAGRAAGTAIGATESGPGTGASAYSASSAPSAQAALGSAASSGAAAGSGAASGSSGGPSNAPSGASGGAPAATSGTGAATAGGGSSQAGDGPGVTATTIYLAGTYQPQSEAADSAIGASNINPGDQKAETDAMARYINDHGGIAHRQVSIVYYQVSLSDSADQTDQAACSDWTQDHKTFVLAGGTPILDQCVANEHGIGLGSGAVAETTPTLAQYPSDINPVGFTIDRGDRVTVDGLARQGFFSPTAKVGVATWDYPSYHYGIDHGVLPALAALGVHNAQFAYVAPPQSYNDLGATSSSVASAVLQFHSEGIDHVILLDGPVGINESGVLVLEWMQQANSQHYYPKYGLNSTSGFSTLAPDYPAQELAGSIGVGWVPSADLDSADYSALPQTANQKACVQIMTAAGQAPSNGNQEALEFSICDEFFLLQYVFGKVAGPLNQQTALAAFDSVGSSFSDLTTFGTYYSASQHDAAQLVRNVAFVASCDCYRYTSAPYSAG